MLAAGPEEIAAAYPLFERTERPRNQRMVVSKEDPGVIAFRFHQLDIRYAHNTAALPLPQKDPFTSRVAVPAQLVKRRLKSGWNNGLEQVVECIHLESSQSMLIVGCGENNFRNVLQAVQQIEARHARHLDIEKKQIRVMMLN